ncbi:MAG: hypothetical protein SOR61_00675 [Evtepia sp.]|uniref:hypothetical protein n=1 Tax=Evtepia sp. TaxID=2773933 RepID=UPI002A75EFC4|nr:hypothetical protein [Evtepia sp.]MDY3013718.1 hypothetical protein [Evtepia sp.]
MTSKQLRDLFFQTGLPEAYLLARAKERREQKERRERRDNHASNYPGDRSPGDNL